MIAGVCGGLSQYFNVDPVIIRAVFALGIFFGGVTPLIYIVLWIAMPEEGAGQPQSYAPPRAYFPQQQAPAAPPAQQYQGPTGEWKYDPYTGQPIQKQ